MQTLKTAVVVVLLLVVFYGVYEMLNRPPDDPPEEVAQIDDLSFEPPEIQFGESVQSPLSEPALSLPPAGNGSTLTSPVPPSTMTLPPTAYPTPPSTEAPPLPTTAADTLPGDPDSQLAVSPPPSPTNPLPPPTTVPRGADAAAPPGDPRLQQNPFVHENVVASPSDTDRTAAAQLGVRGYERARKAANDLIDEGQYHEALSVLSIFYKSQDLTAQEHRELLDVLDPLAGRVVYSREHLVEPAYTVRRNETLGDIAARYNVPTELLQKINGIDNPDVLVPGTQLKVVTGPFRAEVDLQAQELTVFLDGLYAGRFPISLGQDPSPSTGEFQVRDKREDRAYFGLDGRQFPAGSPANPFGKIWLDLGREVCIHGSPGDAAGATRGCISLSPQDAEDVYSILSIGSTVRILR